MAVGGGQAWLLAFAVKGVSGWRGKAQGTLRPTPRLEEGASGHDSRGSLLSPQYSALTVTVPPAPAQGGQLLDSNSWPAGNCQAIPPHGASHVALRLRGDVARYEGLVRCQRGPREDPKSPREGGQWPYQEELVCRKFPRWSPTVRGLRAATFWSCCHLSEEGL